MQTARESYADTFLSYFEINLAQSKAQRDNIGRIRYRVYCEEFGYEAKETFVDGMERDDFDHQSLHCLVTHKSSETPAACVRTVINRGDATLPFEKFCAGSLDSDFFKRNPMSRNTMCEVSRLAVDGMFRRRSGEQATRFGGVHLSDISQQEQRTFPLIAVSCFLAANIMADLAGRTNLFAMMEPFLPRLLKRSGIHFNKVGQDIDYHGLRAPYFVTTSAVREGIVPELVDLYTTIQQILSKDYQSG